MPTMASVGRGHIRQRGPNTWEISAPTGPDPRRPGKYRRITRTVHGPKKAANQALTKLLGEVDAGQHRGSVMTLGALIEEWLKDFQKDSLGAGAYENYCGYYRNRIAPELGHIPIAKLTTVQLDRFYRRLVSEEHLAPSTVRAIHSIIRGSLRQAVKWQYLSASPAAEVTLPRGRKADVQVTEVSDTARMLDYFVVRNPEMAVFLFLAAATGARRGELCGLRWTDIERSDDGQLELTVARTISTVKGKPYLKPTPKTERIRRFSLYPEVGMVLERHRAAMEKRASDGGTGLRPDAFIFSEALDGSKFWNPNRTTTMFCRARAALGIPATARLHGLRHSHATALLSLGVDVRTVAGRLGHSNPATTLSVYAHFQPVADRAAAELFSQSRYALPGMGELEKGKGAE